MTEAERRAPSALKLVAPDTMNGGASSDDTEEELFAITDCVVIAGIVPVPPTIPSAVRDALERMMMTLRFGGDTDLLDRWLHADNPALGGASPFERLVAGDGVGVLRVLLRNGERPRGRPVDSRSAKRRQMLQPVR
jgi:hypothetical protein